MLSRIQAFRRKHRRRRASKRDKAPLREFVYLDEVSVYSLIASRLGPVAKEFTQTETSSLQGELAATLGANVVGIGKGEGSARGAVTRTQGSQVLRKSIVQATFKELYELESESMAMCPMSEDRQPPGLRNLVELETACEGSGNADWILDPSTLHRGQLLEVEAELEAEAIFRVSSVVSSFLEIFDENPALFGADAYRRFAQAKSVERILAKLLVGLVPIRGRVLDYEAATLAGRQWIIHRRLLDQLPDAERPPTTPLHVVGVAEQSLFWKDIRRILFSNARFRILARLAEDGLQLSWTPVKLAQVLQSVAPDIADQLNAAGSGALAAMATAGPPPQSEEQKRRMMKEALVAYGQMLARHYGREVTAEDLSRVGLPSEQHCASHGSLQKRREAFEAIAAFVLESLGIQRESVVVAQYRAAALGDAGLDLLGRPMPLMSPLDASSSGTRADERFLDVEFIAIYW